jgi:hypothetical protein
VDSPRLSNAGSGVALAVEEGMGLEVDVVVGGGCVAEGLGVDVRAGVALMVGAGVGLFAWAGMGGVFSGAVSGAAEVQAANSEKLSRMKARK